MNEIVRDLEEGDASMNSGNVDLESSFEDAQQWDDFMCGVESGEYDALLPGSADAVATQQDHAASTSTSVPASSTAATIPKDVIDAIKSAYDQACEDGNLNVREFTREKAAEYNVDYTKLYNTLRYYRFKDGKIPRKVLDLSPFMEDGNNIKAAYMKGKQVNAAKIAQELGEDVRTVTNAVAYMKKKRKRSTLG